MLIPSGVVRATGSPERGVTQRMHTISSHRLHEYVAELTAPAYSGRLTGTTGYRAAAQWVAERFRRWGMEPAGDDGSWFQHFDIPYTLVFPGSVVRLHLTQDNGQVICKDYRYEEEYIPGSTSASGEVTAEVVYVGYGISAPELGFDEYAGVNVAGKIVLMEPEVPVSPETHADMFSAWRPYSFHQYKLRNAVAHGARGMLYNYGPIANPNNAYDPNFIYSHVGDVVAADLFAGTGREHAIVVKEIRETLQPRSATLGKTVTIRNHTEHHPEGRGCNVLALLPGHDPELRQEVIIVGAHLDHVGRCDEIMPGANDNASGIAVLLGVAEALAGLEEPLQRSVLFICFGAEEQALVGSQHYLAQPVFPLAQTRCLLNLDGVGCGDKLSAMAAENFPALWEFIRRANANYVHRTVTPRLFHNLARPRLDAAWFMWREIPTISFSSYGAPCPYHVTRDNLDIITPEIMEDLGQILFLAIAELAGQAELPDLKNGGHR